MPTQGRLYSANQEANCGNAVSSVQLFRNFISQLNANLSGPGNGNGEVASDEILLDVELDGSRYLLIRGAIPNKTRLQLSPREQEIVRMVAEGHPNKVIAAVLNISSWTVGTHLRRIFAKLGVGSRAAMVARCLEISRGTGARQPIAGYGRFASVLPDTARQIEDDLTNNSKTA